jgi:hypothetical protein
MKKIIAVVCFISVFACNDLLAQRQGFILDSPRRTAMGGAGVALQGTDNAVFLNPALLPTIDRTRVEILNLRMIVNQNAFNQYGFYKDHQDEFDNLSDMTDTERNRFYDDLLGVARDQTVFGFSGMAPVTVVSKGFSFGVYERALLDYDLQEGAAAVPLLQADAVAEGEVILGYGRDLSTFFGHVLDVGVNAKYLYRAVSFETRTAPAMDTIDNMRVYRGWAMAFDLGFFLDTGRWSYGAGLYDFNWPRIRWKTNDEPADGYRTPEETVAGSMRLGAAFEPEFGLGGMFNEFKFAFDIESPFSEEMGFFKKISIGAESRFANIMCLRAGLHQGYPTIGGAIFLRVLKLEYAFGGEALGRHPGQLESWNHVISLGLGWGY